MHASTKRWDRGRILEVRYGGPTRILVDALSVSHLQFFAPEESFDFTPGHNRTPGYWSHRQCGAQIVSNLISAERRLKLF